MTPCLETGILHLVAEHVEAAEGRGERVDILPVVKAMASALGQTIAATDADSRERVASLVIVRDQIAAALVQDAIEGAMSRPGDRVTVGMVN